jgi:serine/threonine protein kinase
MDGDQIKPEPTSVETIFNAALSVPSVDREEYLKSACGEDPQVYRRVDALLRAHESAEGFLPEQANDKSVLKDLVASEVTLPASEKLGDTIGRYKLLQNIGEGGCGAVYMAEQEQPVRRRVALKVIKLGMDTKQVVARFEAERQALALMDHENIAKVLDAGATETGRPFFVMELVRGVKITDYCDQKCLSTEERLELFVKVCRAIEHAHQKGIIHRDIKPSNILVTLHDGVPVPKVIDFGIAKATQGRLTDRTLFTAFEQFIGTPAYMSPEQAEMSGLDVDTRSDIYSLGVLLYELLTSRTPFNAKELLASGLEAMRHTIRETEPTPPSTMLSTMLKGDLAEAAEHRRVDASKLITAIRGDLEWIVMKCLDKDRARRYETATALAAEVQRYMKNEPIQARPPSKIYLFQKLLRRHKFLFASAGAVSGALLIGLGLSTWLWIKEREARTRAVAAERSMEKSSRIAAENAQQAGLSARKSQQVAQLLKDILNGVGPSVALGRDTTVLREILSNGVQRVGYVLKAQPDLEAELLHTMGMVYVQLADYEKAEALCRTALDRRLKASVTTNDENVALAYFDLSQALWQQGKWAEAESTQRTALAIREALPEPDQRDIARSLHALGQIMAGQGRQGEAQDFYNRALQIRKAASKGDDAEIAESLVDLGEVEGKWEEAEIMFRQALLMDRRLYTDMHPAVANVLHSLAKLLLSHDKESDAETLARDALTIRIKLFGDQHPLVAETRTTLARALLAEGKVVEAEAEARRALAVQQNRLNTDHPGLADTLDVLTELFLPLKRESELEQIFQELPLKGNAPGNQIADLVAARGTFFARIGRWTEAAADFTTLVELHPQDHDNYHCLAPLLVQIGHTNAYLLLREQIKSRFGSVTNDEAIADRMAKDCLILPDPASDYSVEAKLANVAVTLGAGTPGEPWFQFCNGFAEFRQAHFPAAIEWMQKVLQTESANGNRAVEAYMVMAMSNHKLKQSAEAQALLTKGLKVWAQNPADFRSSKHSFIDWIIAQTLIREARACVSEPERGTLNP